MDVCKNEGFIARILAEETSEDAAIARPIEELFFLQDYQERKLYLIEDIEWETAAGLIRSILRFNQEDKDLPADARETVTLYISSNGGDADACRAMIDAIRCSTTPVRTVNVGACYSAGFLIYIAGHTRYSMPNSSFLLHDGEGLIANSIAKARDFMDFNRISEDRTRDFILSVSKVTPELYARKYRTEWFMFPEEAKECGFVDYIVGQDCDLDDII